MNRESENVRPSRLRPCYTCCHPNGKGTGSTVRFELHPAHGSVEGSMFVTFAAQKTIGSFGNGERVLPTFDWENRITVRLSVNEIAQMLEVFRGYRESICDGNGLFHKTAKSNSVITLEHRIEPAPGYLFSVSRRSPEGERRRIGVLLSVTESIVLGEALAGSALYMAFGVPSSLVRERDGNPAASVASAPDQREKVA